MKNYLIIFASIIFLSVGWSQCDSGYVELWGECYSIESTISLDLYGDGLTGEISPEIGNLVNLEAIYLSSNGLTGEIPSEIGNLINLTHLSLPYNQLIGEIPSEIGNLINLEELYLLSNELSGVIPESICNIYPNLSYFLITHNKLCPPYPDCLEEDIGYQNTSECLESQIGDVNQDTEINVLDVVLVVNFALAIVEPTEEQYTLSDLNEDGFINVIDVIGVVNLVLNQ